MICLCSHVARPKREPGSMDDSEAHMLRLSCPPHHPADTLSPPAGRLQSHPSQSSPEGVTRKAAWCPPPSTRTAIPFLSVSLGMHSGKAVWSNSWHFNLARGGAERSHVSTWSSEGYLKVAGVQVSANSRHWTALPTSGLAPEYMSGALWEW